MSAAMHTVHVRVNDAATGQPTPVRLRITDAAGNYYAPFGRVAAFATGRSLDVGGNVQLRPKRYAYIDGSCEIRLPAGPLTVEIHKGPEYRSVGAEVHLPAGKLALRFAVERWTDRRQEGWYAGDTRAHFLTPHAALLEAAAEDLAVVNLLATECRLPGPGGQTFAAIPNIVAFSGQQPALAMPGHLVAVNTHNTHPVLGSLGLLHCHRAVYPLSFGGPDGADDWSLADWCDQCHRKNGLVVWTRAGHESRDFLSGEPLADLILGKVDALEVDGGAEAPFDVLSDWYALLNCGLRVSLVGGSGKDSNGIPLGSVRTYARLAEGEELTYRTWIEAVRAGRTFATNGPLLRFTVNGRDPGTVLDLPEPGQPLPVRAEAHSQVPFAQLELVADGAVVATAAAAGSPAAAVLETTWTPTVSGWLAARCHSPQQGGYAHTTPVYVQIGGRPPRADPAAQDRLLSQLDRMREWVEREARCPTDRHRTQWRDIFQTARDDLARR